jgi:hypothetical protein
MPDAAAPPRPTPDTALRAGLLGNLCRLHYPGW